MKGIANEGNCKQRELQTKEIADEGNGKRRELDKGTSSAVRCRQLCSAFSFVCMRCTSSRRIASRTRLCTCMQTAHSDCRQLNLIADSSI